MLRPIALWMPFAVITIAAPLPLGSASAEAEQRLVTARPASREIVLTGFTRARAELPLVAEVAGRIETVHYDIGDAIAGAGIFAGIDPTFIRLELEEVAVEQERLSDQITHDQREAERYRELARRDNVSASQAEALEQALRDNRHALRTLEIRRKVLLERLARTRIGAPAGWRVTARLVEPGQWVDVGEAVGAVADFTTLLTPFGLTPAQHAALHRQVDNLTLSLTDLAQRVPARLFRANPAFDPGTRKIRVELEVGGDPQPRRGGLRAELRLAVPEDGGAVLLPAAAVGHSYEEHWVIRANGERIPVLVLGRGAPGDMVRVRAPSIAPGQRFRRIAED